MDCTTVSLGTATRDALAKYRDEHNHPSYNEAISTLLQEVNVEN